MKNAMQAILDKYGHKEGLSMSGDKITEWPYSEKKPTQAELGVIASEYTAKTAYILSRKSEYPSIEDQLDMIYHGTLTSWKAAIKAIKDKYPKPEE